MMGSESAKLSGQRFSLGGHAASQAAAKDNELKINRCSHAALERAASFPRRAHRTLRSVTPTACAAR